MNKNIPLLILAAIFSLATTSCHNGSSKQLKGTVDSFATAYFNWRFVDALPHVTAESKKILSFEASQVRQQDVDSLRAMKEGAATEIKDVNYLNDSTATAIVEARQFLSMDSIGKAPHIINKATFHIPLQYRNGIWKVDLRQPLRH